MSLYAILLVLLAREPAAIATTMPRGIAAIEAIVDVVGPDDPATARPLLVWAWSESRFDPRESVRAAVRLLRGPPSEASSSGSGGTEWTTSLETGAGSVDREAPPVVDDAQLLEALLDDADEDEEPDAPVAVPATAAEFVVVQSGKVIAEFDNLPDALSANTIARMQGGKGKCLVVRVSNGKPMTVLRS